MKGAQIKEKFKTWYVKHPDGCWRWIGGLSSGYGRFYHEGKSIRAHRMSWMLYRGKIPKGMLVLHRCNHRYCVNPEHLYIGTPSDNLNDRLEDKGAGQKLTRDDVICIKKMLRDGIRQWLIAWIYQVNRSNIGMINTGRIWANVKI